MTVDVTSDCEGSFATVREAFPGLDGDEPWWIPVNVALLRTGDTTLLVDAVAPADVDIVVNTHLHIDHVGWNGVFPNARYVVHEDDWYEPAVGTDRGARRPCRA